MSLVRNGSNRVMVYPNEIAFETDILRTNMYKMSDIAFLAQTLIGNGFGLGNAFGGLPCTVTSPLSLNVLVGPGAAYSLQEYDATAYSSIPSDTTDNIYKQAVNLSTISTATSGFFPGGPITAPATVGYSVYWIIEAEFSTQDLNDTNRPYYDSSNPSVPQFNSYADTRQDYIAFKLKQGTPYNSTSPDITQVPTADAGYTALYALFVTHGQTTITGGDIVVYPGAPFITPSIINAMTYANFQNNYPVYANDTGTANTYVATGSVTYGALQAGTQLKLQIANTNTGASTLAVDGLGIPAIRKKTPLGLNALVGGELVAGNINNFIFDGTYWQLEDPAIPASYTATILLNDSQVIGGSATLLTLNASTLLPDIYGIISYTGSPTYKFTANKAGRYQISCSVDYVLVGIGVTNIYIFTNGIQNEDNIFAIDNTAAGTETGSQGNSTVFTLNAGDYIQFYAAANNATSSTLSSSVNCYMSYLGA